MCGDSGLSIGYVMSHYAMRGGVPEPLGTTFLHGDVYENNHVGEKKNLKDIAKLFMVISLLQSIRVLQKQVNVH